MRFWLHSTASHNAWVRSTRCSTVAHTRTLTTLCRVVTTSSAMVSTASSRIWSTSSIDQHSDRLLLVRAACVAEGNLPLGSMSLGTVSRLS